MPPSARPKLPFRAVNRPGASGYQTGLQRHHLLPRQLLDRHCFAPLIAALGPERIGFDDFRRNGLLLPASDDAAVRMALPLHRGPHRDYNALVFERVGEIETRWSKCRIRVSDISVREALAGLAALQATLRRQLLSQRRELQLNRRDPVRPAADFAALDAMAAQLWAETGA